jgi:hypothetical protein
MHKNILSQDFHFSRTLCTTDWGVTDVSAQPISPILKRQAVQVECWKHLGNSYKGNAVGSDWFLQNVTLATVRSIWSTWTEKKNKEVGLPSGWQLLNLAV